jgi:hypothetical protein
LQNVESKLLTLVISPFLKESHKTYLKNISILRGNYPIFIFQQFQLFHFFLSNCIYTLSLSEYFANKRICIYKNSNFYATVDITTDVENITTIKWTLYNKRTSYPLTMMDYNNQTQHAIFKNILPPDAKSLFMRINPLMHNTKSPPAPLTVPPIPIRGSQLRRGGNDSVDIIPDITDTAAPADPAASKRFWNNMSQRPPATAAFTTATTATATARGVPHDSVTRGWTAGVAAGVAIKPKP